MCVSNSVRYLKLIFIAPCEIFTAEELQKIHDIRITLLSLFDCLPGSFELVRTHSVLPLYIPPTAKTDLINYLYIGNAPRIKLQLGKQQTNLYVRM